MHCKKIENIYTIFMTRTKNTDNTPPEHGSWVRSNTMLPQQIFENISAMGKDRDMRGGLRGIHTAAIALFVGFPEEIHEMLYRWVTARSHRPSEIQSSPIVELFAATLIDRMKENLTDDEAALVRRTLDIALGIERDDDTESDDTDSDPDQSKPTHFISRIIDPEMCDEKPKKQSASPAKTKKRA